MASSAAHRPAYKPITRPKFGYDFSQLVDFPKRLLFPPDAGVGHVRSFKITPKFEVALNDVLDGKHLPPLTLKDFEEYLVFVERSPENLYFICWLRDYTKQYNQWEASIAHLAPEDRPKSYPELTLSWARARATFFSNTSHLELNLPSDVIDALDSTKGLPHPTPAMLAPVQQQVESMLRESLMRFVGTACSNSGRRRGLFAIFVGAVVIAIGLIPVLLSIYRGESRGVRLTGLPAFWFGATTAIAGFHGVCVVIFLFGDARQLFPYELARPILDPLPQLEPLTLPMPVTAPRGAASHGMSGTDSSTIAASDEERSTHKITVSSQYDTDDRGLVSNRSSSGIDEKANGRPDSNNEWDAYLPDTAGFIPSSYPASISSTTLTSTAYSSAAKRQSISTSVPLHFDFDQLPAPPPPSIRRSEYTDDTSSNFSKRLPVRGTFCRMTKVLSPVISRAQWEIVMRSALIAVFVAVCFAAIMYAIPFRH